MAKYAAEAIEPIGSSEPVHSPKKIKEIMEAMERMSLPIEKPLLTRATDVLQPSTQITASPLSAKPKLESPDPSFSRTLSEFQYLKAMDQMKTQSNRIIDSMLERLNIYKRQIQTLSDKQIEKIRENADKAASGYWWSLLTKIGTALLSVLSIALGIALGAGVLVASGVISLVNFIFIETNLWSELAKSLAQNDEEMKQRIAMALPITLGIISMGLSLFGGTQNVAQVSQFLGSNVPHILKAVVVGFQGVAGIGHAITQGSMVRARADLTNIQEYLSLEETLQETAATWISTYMPEIKGINKSAGQVAAMVMQEYQKVIQG
jgi:hypothetical protein